MRFAALIKCPHSPPGPLINAANRISHVAPLTHALQNVVHTIRCTPHCSECCAHDQWCPAPAPAPASAPGVGATEYSVNADSVCARTYACGAAAALGRRILARRRRPSAAAAPLGL